MTHDAVAPLSQTAYGADGWLGLENLHADARLGYYMDRWLLLVFGGIPWQVRAECSRSLEASRGRCVHSAAWQVRTQCTINNMWTGIGPSSAAVWVVLQPVPSDVADEHTQCRAMLRMSALSAERCC